MGSAHSRKSALDIMAQCTDTWCTLAVFVHMRGFLVVCACVCFRPLELSLERIAAADKCSVTTSRVLQKV